MTLVEYRRRIDLGFRVAQWRDDNCFKPLVITRLEGIGPAAYGGSHAPTTPATDASIIRTEPAVELARETAAALSEPGTAF